MHFLLGQPVLSSHAWNAPIRCPNNAHDPPRRRRKTATRKCDCTICARDMARDNYSRIHRPRRNCRTYTSVLRGATRRILVRRHFRRQPVALMRSSTPSNHRDGTPLDNVLPPLRPGYTVTISMSLRVPWTLPILDIGDDLQTRNTQQGVRILQVD